MSSVNIPQFMSNYAI